MVRALTRAILFIFIALQLNAPLMHAHVASDGGIAGVHFHPQSVAPNVHAQDHQSRYGNWDSSDHHFSQAIEVSRALQAEPAANLEFVAFLIAILGFATVAIARRCSVEFRQWFSFYSRPPAPIRAPPAALA